MVLLSVANDYWVARQAIVLQSLSVVSCHHGGFRPLVLLLLLNLLLLAIISDQDGAEERVLRSCVVA